MNNRKKNIVLAISAKTYFHWFLFLLSFQLIFQLINETFCYHISLHLEEIFFKTFIYFFIWKADKLRKRKTQTHIRIHREKARTSICGFTFQMAPKVHLDQGQEPRILSMSSEWEHSYLNCHPCFPRCISKWISSLGFKPALWCGMPVWGSKWFNLCTAIPSYDQEIVHTHTHTHAVKK